MAEVQKEDPSWIEATHERINIQAEGVAAEECDSLTSDESNPIRHGRKRSISVEPKPDAIQVVNQGGGTWKPEFPTFRKVTLQDEGTDKMRAKTRAFYMKQNALVDAFGSVTAKYYSVGDEEDGVRDEEPPTTRVAIQLSFWINVFLLGIKLVATIMSGSIAVLASFLDSLLDLMSGLILLITEYFISRRDPYEYPQGKARLEPIGTMLFACVMGVSSLQIVIEAMKRIVAGISGDAAEIDAGLFVVAIMCSTILLKTGLWVFCQRVAEATGSSAVEAYAQDHRNDILTNTLGLLAVLASANASELWPADPVAGTMIAVYIIVTWAQTGYEQVQMLAGKSAGSDFIQKLTFTVCSHDERIQKVDTVRAYHFGENFLVEVDIVLSEEMTLKETHDIGESLQIVLEDFDEIERAFVHIDYEYDHKPVSYNDENSHPVRR